MSEVEFKTSGDMEGHLVARTVITELYHHSKIIVFTREQFVTFLTNEQRKFCKLEQKRIAQYLEEVNQKEQLRNVVEALEQTIEQKDLENFELEEVIKNIFEICGG